MTELFAIETNNLRNMYPKIADQWHPTKNGSLIPENVAPKTNKKVWWQKECIPGSLHEWEAVVSSRTSAGNGCPVCSGRNILIGFNDLYTTNRVIAEEWHPTKNGYVTPQSVIAGSKRKVWWRKECVPDSFHEWEAMICSRVNSGNGCSVCSGHTILIGFNDLRTIYPAIAEEWHPTKNGLLTPENLTVGSHKKVWWRKECVPDSFHEWEAMVKHRTLSGSGCPICSGRNVLIGFNDLRTTNRVIAEQWHPTKNGLLTPEGLTAGSNKKVWWRKECVPDSFHEWEATLDSRTRHGNGCSVCSGHTILIGFNDLRTTCPVIAEEWHPTKNGLLTPEGLTAGSNKKVWWKKECASGIFHEWESTIYNRVKQGDGCSVCSGRNILIGFNDLRTTCPVIAEEWHPTKNGLLTPEGLTAGTNKKVWWRRECISGTFHEWESSISNRARGSGCPYCIGKTEMYFRESFEKMTGYNWKTSNIKLKRLSRLTDRAQIDMINDELKVVIEYDGAWTHGDNALFKNTLEQKLKHDKETTEALVDYGYNVIRIREHDQQQKLPVVPIDIAYKSKVYQITYKSFGTDKDIIEEIVKKIIENKNYWFKLSESKIG